MVSESTYYYETIYTGLPEGGVGLVGVSGHSPSLRASIFGFRFQEDSALLTAVIRPVQSGETYSDPNGSVYTSLYFGGVGVTSVINLPDLKAVYTLTPAITSGSLDLSAVIQPIQSGELSLGAFWRSSESGSNDISATYTGVTFNNLLAYIVPTISSSSNITAQIEPIPPLDLPAQIQGIFFEDLMAQLEAAEPVTLSATLSGQPILDLAANYFGYVFEDVSATYSGFSFKDLQATITGLGPASGDLSAAIQGFIGINVTDTLSGYIISTSGGQTTLAATITGASIFDLKGSIEGITYEDLPATITGQLFDGYLQATILPTGSLLNLSAFIYPSQAQALPITATIDGTGAEGLPAEINSDSNDILYGNITATGNNFHDLLAEIQGVSDVTLSATYDITFGNLLSAQIETIDGPKLFAVIEPNVFYIESSILINTYPLSDLRAVINADICLPRSDFSDLAVVISGNSAKDLSASVIGIGGQLAISVDEIPVLVKQKVIQEDWMFFIFDQLAYAQDTFELILTNSPLSNLRAIILGVQATGDLGASISPNYIPPIARTGVPIGQWVNFKTGETKLLRLFFQGNARNFYWSEEADKTFSENPNDSLEIIVESYKRASEEDSLLNVKTDVKRCQVNVDGFPSMDEAIKYAIACSLSELSGDLTASITAVGHTSDFSATVSGIDDNTLSDLKAAIVPVASDPDLYATVTPTGSLMDLNAIISPVHGQVTSTPFFDTNGNRYLPTLLIQPDGSYSVVLTPISPSGIVNVISPDLEVQISGIAQADLSSTISGS